MLSLNQKVRGYKLPLCSAYATISLHYPHDSKKSLISPVDVRKSLCKKGVEGGETTWISPVISPMITPVNPPVSPPIKLHAT